MTNLPPRLKGIAATYGHRLLDAIKLRNESAALARLLDNRHLHSPSAVIAKFAEFDPTANKALTQWLVVAYMGGGFRLEDLAKARETLELFVEHGGKLEECDIGRYHSLGGLWKAVEPHIDAAATDETLTGRALRRKDRDRARAESEIPVERDDGLIVAVPLTEFAAKWWGRGTRWCTAADEDNYFRQYHNEAPLLVIVLPDGEKFQLWCGDDFQFMDAADEAVKAGFVAENWEYFERVIRYALSRNGLALEYIPEQQRDRDLCLEAVKQNGRALRYVPEQQRDRGLCMEAVRQNGRALRYVPEQQRDRGLCMEAVKQNGWALAYVPEQHRDRDLCLEAVSQYGGALQYVPQQHHDYVRANAVSNQEPAQTTVAWSLDELRSAFTASIPAKTALDNSRQLRMTA